MPHRNGVAAGARFRIIADYREERDRRRAGANHGWKVAPDVLMEALEPERVLLLPDGDEDLWSDDYADLVSLA